MLREKLGIQGHTFVLANIGRLAELLHLLLKASDASEWTVVQKLGLIENPQTPAVQAEPENCADVRRSAQIQGSASDQTPIQGTDGSASSTPRIVSPGEACSTELPSSASERCQASKQQVEPPWRQLVLEDSVTCSSSTWKGSVETLVVTERSVPGLQHEAPWKRADSDASKSALSKAWNSASKEQLGTSSTQCPDPCVPGGPPTLAAGGGRTTAVPTSESQSSLTCKQELLPPWRKSPAEDKATCTSSPRDASTDVLLTPESHSVPGSQEARPWHGAHGNSSTCASDHVWTGDGLQQPGTSPTQSTDRFAFSEPAVVCPAGGSSTVLPSPNKEGMCVDRQLAAPPGQRSKVEHWLTSSSAAQTTVSEPWSAAEKGVQERQQVAPWQTAGGEMSATASEKPLSGADDEDLRTVTAQESSTAANVVLKRSAAVNQLSSNAASGSSPRLASAAAGSSASSHLKHARTATNHTSRRQSLRDAPVTSESSSTSESPEGRRPGGLPASAHSANEVRYGWGDVQMPYAVPWATGAMFYSVQRFPPVLRDNRFCKDRHRRVYICDQCNAHVPWCGQAQAFDGAYSSYDNKTPLEFLPKLWERGRDFRWYCTMCYAKWWEEDDLAKVRHRIGLTAKVERRKARARIGERPTASMPKRDTDRVSQAQCVSPLPSELEFFTAKAFYT